MMRLDTGALVSAVPTDMIDAAWTSVVHLIDGCVRLDYGLISTEDIYQALKGGQAALWIAEKDMNILAVCVTEIVIYPKAYTLRIWIISGEGYVLWKDAIAQLEMYARHNNCRYIEAISRPGIAKVAKALGFEHTRTMIVKPVNMGTH